MTGASPASQAVPTRPHPAIAVLIATSGLLSGLAMTGLSPLLPRIEASFAPSPAQAYLGKMIVAIVGLSIMLAAPLVGPIARRLSCGRILVLSLVCYAVGAVGSSLAPSLPWLIAARFVQGSGVAIGVTVLLALAGTLYPPAQRDRLLGWHMGGGALALMVLLPVAGWLGDHNWRFAPLLGLLCLAHLALAVAARRALDFPLATTSAEHRRLQPDERQQVGVVIALAFLLGVTLYSAAAFLPYKMVRVGLTSARDIGLLATLATAASALGSLGYAFVAARLPGLRLYLLALPCCAAGALTVALSNGIAAIALAQLATGLGGGLLLAHMYADCAERLAPELRPFATGLVKSASFAGLFLGPLLIEVVVARFNPDAAFWALAAVAGSAMLVARLGRPARPRTRPLGAAA